MRMGKTWLQFENFTIDSGLYGKLPKREWMARVVFSHINPLNCWRPLESSLLIYTLKIYNFLISSFSLGWINVFSYLHVTS